MPLNERINTWGDTQPTEYIGPAEPRPASFIGAIAELLGLGAYQRGETAGRPQSAPGVGYDALAGILGLLDPQMTGGKALATKAAPGLGMMLGVTLDDLMRIYPGLKARRGLSSVPIVDTIKELGAPTQEVHDLLKSLSSGNKVELVSHGRTQAIPDEERAMMLPGPYDQLFAWWRPK